MVTPGRMTEWAPISTACPITRAFSDYGEFLWPPANCSRSAEYRPTVKMLTRLDRVQNPSTPPWRTHHSPSRNAAHGVGADLDVALEMAEIIDATLLPDATADPIEEHFRLTWTLCRRR